METKFTPGPWQVETSGDNDDITEIYICKEGGGIILCINDGDDNYDMEGDLANAKLIAASPELYKALVGLNQAIDAYWNADSKSDALVKEITRWQQISLAALNKAT